VEASGIYGRNIFTVRKGKLLGLAPEDGCYFGFGEIDYVKLGNDFTRAWNLLPDFGSIGVCT